MATATCILSGEAFNNGGHSEFQTTFIPPINCSGRSCYLKVTNIAAMVAQSTTLAQFVTFFITMDFSQPFSYGSINNTLLPVPAVNDNRLVEKDRRNQVVAMFQTGGIGTNAGNAGGYTLTSQTNFPRILVEIPDGPQTVTVGLWKAYGSQGQALNQLSVMFELTPIDTDDLLHLQI